MADAATTRKILEYLAEHRNQEFTHNDLMMQAHLHPDQMDACLTELQETDLIDRRTEVWATASDLAWYRITPKGLDYLDRASSST